MTVQWTVVRDFVDATTAEAALAVFKQYKKGTSHTVPCTICTVATPHKMRYQLLSCSSSKCDISGQQAHCQWRGRVMECDNTRKFTINECGEHNSLEKDTKKNKLTEAHKTYIREMAAQGLRPGRIRNSMPRKFNVRMDDLPELKVVQNFSNYFRKTKMMNNDYVDELTEYIRGLEFNGTEEDSASFTISCQKDDAGHIEVGTGSDKKPFVVGVTSKRLLSRLDRPVDSFVFHVDATFKVAQVEYPVLVCGMSDRCRSFHLVALFVTSQRLEAQYTDMLNALRSVFFRVMQKPLKVRYVMGDAEEAQYNAIQTTFGYDNVLKVTMCFYHVVANVLKRTKSMESYHASKVIRDIYDMHFSRNAYECATLARSRVTEWKTSPQTQAFGVYFENQWLKGKFVRWQCFQTPPGFASTNNPVEQFNKKLKRDYTLRQKMKMGTLLQQLVSCCHNESSSFDFKTQVEIPKALKVRANELAKQNVLLEVVTGVQDHVANQNRRIFSFPTPKMVEPSRNKTVEALAVCAQMSSNYARMEREGQPQWGWEVDLTRRSCPCNYFFKFVCCIHLLHALKVSGAAEPVGKATLVYRGTSKKRQRETQTTEPHVPVGRPRTNGFALDME